MGITAQPIDDVVGELPAPAPEIRRMVRVLLQEGSPSLHLANQDSVSIYLNSPFEANAPSVYDGPGDLNIAQCGANLCISSGAQLVLKTSKSFYVQTFRKVLNIDGIGAYRGLLQIKNTKKKGLQAINVVHVEDYLRGVVPAEIGKIPPNAFEALKAQAIAARTYSIRNLRSLDKVDYDLSSTVKSQVYKGVKVEYALADSAISETRDLVMIFGGKPIDAYFHANSGGFTADPSEIWGKGAAPYLTAHPDEQAANKAWSRNANTFKWKREWPRSVFDSLVKGYAIKAGGRPKIIFSQVLGMEIQERGRDGRIKKLQIQTNQGPIYFGGDYLRLLLPDARSERLPSSRFDIVQFDSSKVILRGSGYGHGVGLDQSGSIQRSLYGQDYMEILAAYYPGTEIKPLSSVKAEK